MSAMLASLPVDLQKLVYNKLKQQTFKKCR